jgi:hypothetical protein
MGDILLNSTIVRTIKLVLFVLPLIYVSEVLCIITHEVLGHGLTALLLGGQFSGFAVKWDTMGWALADIPVGAPVTHHILYLASGIIVTTICGVILWGLVFLFRRRPDVQLALLIAAFIFLIDGIDYILWNSYHPIGTGDVSRIILFCHLLEFPDPVVLRWTLFITGVLLFVGVVFYFCTSIFVRVEALVLN